MIVLIKRPVPRQRWVYWWCLWMLTLETIKAGKKDQIFDKLLNYTVSSTEKWLKGDRNAEIEAKIGASLTSYLVSVSHHGLVWLMRTYKRGNVLYSHFINSISAVKRGPSRSRDKRILSVFPLKQHQLTCDWSRARSIHSIQLQSLLFSVPIKIMDHTIPHFNAPINDKID